MSEASISSLHIEKLGHKLEEIRVRALDHIISKLDLVETTEINFSRYVDLLKKLFEWFGFRPHSEEEKVLTLIYRILKSETGQSLIKHIGSLALIRDLKEIRTKIATNHYPIIDNTIYLIDSTYDIHNITQNPELRLISDIPLSFRSDQSVFPQFSDQSRIGYTGDNSPSSYRSPDFSKNNTNRNITGSYSASKYIGSTATTISGFEQKSASVSGLKTCHPTSNSPSPSLTPVRDILYRSVPYTTFNWQPLVNSDCHVLKSVEESLERPPQPTILIHSCDFFCNVMLQDFPCEVFLQRPKILMLFYDMIQNSPSTRITNAALLCLNKLCENLLIRIRYYGDPCTYNLMHECKITNEPNITSSSTRRTFTYNIDLNNIGKGDYDIGDSSEFEQLTLPQFCVKTFMCVLTYISEKPQSFKDTTNRKKTQSGINISLQLIDKLVTLITLCVKPTIWSYQKDSTISEICSTFIALLNKLGDVLEQYRLMVVATDMEYFERMAQLHLLQSTSYLLTELIPLTNSDQIVPRSLKSALSSSLLDSSFGKLYPTAHENLVQFVNEFKGQNETESLIKYIDVKMICKSMTKAVKILQDSSGYTVESLRMIRDSLPCFEFHKNLSIINTFFKICVQNNSMFNLDEVTAKIIEDILLSLLSHPDEDIRKEIYSLSQKLITNILGLNHSKHMSQSDPGSQIIFFFRPAIFIEISAHGLTSESVQIQTQAEDILIHILKCKFLVSENVWKKLIKAIMPAMPILQCFASYGTPLGKSIIKILDPDISPSLFISQIDILKGNLRMLFCKDVKLRNEAVSRLCWLLTTEENANKKIPKIKSLEDCGLSNIFQIEYPIDLCRKRGTQQFYQVSSLQQVIDLLSTKNIEPSIRRSALTQIGVMLDDQFMHPYFLEQHGIEIILDIFNKSLFDNEYHNYPDSVIPVISILKNICLSNAIIRQDLALDLQLVFNILRALFLYCTDKRIQYDGALLCCLLLFSEFAVYTQSTKESSGFSLPDIVMQNLRVPIKCHTHWKTSKHTKPSLLRFLMSDDWCKSTLRMHWNIEWFGGVSEIINWTKAPVISTLTKDQLAEFSSDLRLTKIDLLGLKASSISYCCQQYLYDIENSTTHQSVVDSVRGVTGYIGLWLVANKNSTRTPDEKLLNLPWCSAFNRFLSSPPANDDDETLLIEILRCMTSMLRMYKNSGKHCWMSDILQDTSHYLPKLLQIDVKNEQRIISIEILTLISGCCTLEQQLLDIGLISGIDNFEDKSKNWLHVIQIITENLKFSDTDQFYNLSYLDKLLWSLVQITSNLGWSELYLTSAEFQKVFTELIEALSELLTAFHYGKGREAAQSFMGLSITRNSVLTMNHILYEMQHTLKKNWETFWVTHTVCRSTLFNLFSLWSCRDVVIRAATLQLLSGICSSPRGTTVIVENVRHNYKNIWESAITIMLDHTEASIVREHAAILLTNISSHVNISATGQVSLPLAHAPLTSNNSTSPMDAVLTLLKVYNFFEELDILLACLYLDTNFDPSLISITKNKNDIIYTTSVLAAMSGRSYVQTSTESPGSNHESTNVFVTPSFVKSAANFVSNLLYLAPEPISAAMADSSLVKGFFRCLTAPSLDITDSKNFLLYTDTLEMCSSVCSLLTRSILVNNSCRDMALHTRDCLHVLISLLNPNLYNVQQPHFLFLRNQLWCEIFRFLTALLDTSKSSTDLCHESFNVISTLLTECGHESFFKSVCASIESTSTGLQKSALQSLTSLLTIETILPVKKMNLNSTFSLQNLLDTLKSPRDIRDMQENIENLENIDPKSHSLETQTPMHSLAESYKNILENIPKKKFKKHYSPRIAEPDLNIMIGADLCKILLRLYDMQSFETSKDNKRKTIIVGALSSLLNTSEEAKKCALSEGFLTTVLSQLRSLHTELSLHSADSLRKVTEKKKVCPILKEVDSLFCMLTNFIVRNRDAKNSASNLGLADLTHKFWVWFNFERSMLVNILKLLCTFTTDCSKACQSLTLTNAIPGSGPRKISTNMSLLNAVIILINKEMEMISRSHDINILQLCFHLLKNVSSVLECRMIFTKSNLFQSFIKLHPAITKRQRPWEIVENIWLEFLEIFTFYPEGQIHIIRSNEVLELILTLCSCPKSSNKLIALSVLRNVAFHHSNRLKLMGSVEFIQLLHAKLTSGTYHEKNVVISMIWSLVANSQRSKIVMKCAGLDQRIQDILRQYDLQGINDKSYQIMQYVLGILKEGER